MITSIINNCVNAFPDFFLSAIDGSVINGKVGLGIGACHLEYSFSVRFPDYAPIVQADTIAMSLHCS